MASFTAPVNAASAAAARPLEGGPKQAAIGNEGEEEHLPKPGGELSTLRPLNLCELQCILADQLRSNINRSANSNSFDLACRHINHPRLSCTSSPTHNHTYTMGEGAGTTHVTNYVTQLDR